MLRYRLLPQSLEATCLSLAQTSIRADCPSGKVPTTFVLRLVFCQDFVQVKMRNMPC